LLWRVLPGGWVMGSWTWICAVLCFFLFLCWIFYNTLLRFLILWGWLRLLRLWRWQIVRIENSYCADLTLYTWPCNHNIRTILHADCGSSPLCMTNWLSESCSTLSWSAICIRLLESSSTHLSTKRCHIDDTFQSCPTPPLLYLPLFSPSFYKIALYIFRISFFLTLIDLLYVSTFPPSLLPLILYGVYMSLLILPVLSRPRPSYLPYISSPPYMAGTTDTR
jgi:hypothetical protein